LAKEKYGNISALIREREREREICQVNQWQYQMYTKWQAAREGYAYLCWPHMAIKTNKNWHN